MIPSLPTDDRSSVSILLSSKIGNRRVLVVDDSIQIHDDFRKILGPSGRRSSLDALGTELFGAKPSLRRPTFEVETVTQGELAVDRVAEACAEGSPFSVVFMDVRMPPGMNGIEATRLLLEKDREVHVVLCTAFTDQSPEEINEAVGHADRVLILRKPFDAIEVRQMAQALSRKWELARESRTRLEDLELTVQSALEDRDQLERKLRVAQKLEAVGQLAAGVAHEINSPLQSLDLNVAFLEGAFEDILAVIEAHRACIQKEDPNVDPDSLVEDIPGAVAEMKAGIKTVTNIVGTMNPGTSAGNLATIIDVPNLVEDAIERVQDRRGDDVAIDLLSEYVPNVWGERPKLLQVLEIVLENAIGSFDGYEPPDEAKIVIKTYRNLVGNVCVEITDNGKGISPDIADRVFEPFFTTKDVGQGSGQGLPVARAIVVHSGGSIDFEPAADGGTTFTVQLPSAKESIG